MGVRWVKDPLIISKGLDSYLEKVNRAAFEVGRLIADELQNVARKEAKWEDRTGNARSGLLSDVEEISKTIVRVYLIHSMDYGVYLELALAGKYAIIWPTIEKSLPRIKRTLESVFS